MQTKVKMTVRYIECIRVCTLGQWLLDISWCACVPFVGERVERTRRKKGKAGWEFRKFVSRIETFVDNCLINFGKVRTVLYSSLYDTTGIEMYAI